MSLAYPASGSRMTVGLPSPTHLMKRLYPPTSTFSANDGTLVGGTGVAVGSGVGVGGTGVSVGGMGVFVGGTGVAVGGTAAGVPHATKVNTRKHSIT